MTLIPPMPVESVFGCIGGLANGTCVGGQFISRCVFPMFAIHVPEKIV